MLFFQVMSEISADEWKAGTCFTGVGPATPAKCMCRAIDLLHILINVCRYIMLFLLTIKE